MEPVWMNAYHCLYDRSFEQYVDQLPAAEQLHDELQQRNYMFYWLHYPVQEEVMLKAGESHLLELVGACYTKENGNPIQIARFYRHTHTGDNDFIMVTENGKVKDGLTFEQMIEAGSSFSPIQDDLK
ncbi:hypothetical protein J2S00_001658 [Caldalkalibacillus uzonensis]|uniref:Uncharacterized protein n=1 Tax=Caldalkalibacillus uzonensis TaxID=353224 RepID=A0ABU0CR24_9BACI|nr:hypothetical protein [Caldalkalibacillus uzonensis]MDQ0338872.1 hypothetical protein [Caldalkalibacillus uzonensis]